MREQQGRKNAAEEGYGHIWKCSIVYRMIYIYIFVCVYVCMSLARIAYTVDRMKPR